MSDADRSRHLLEALALKDDDVTDVRSSRDRFDRAAATGRRRRRRTLLVLATTTAVALFAVGAAVLPSGGEPDGLISTNDDLVPPTRSIDSPVVATDVAPTGETVPAAPTTTLPGTLATTPDPTPASAVTLDPTTNEPGIGDPSDGAPSASQPDVFVTVSGSSGAVIDVRDPVRVVASYDLTCPPDRTCTVQSARVMGDTVWVAITESAQGDLQAVMRSRVISVTLSTGAVTEHLALDGTGIVRSAGLGADGLLYALLADREPGERALVAVEAGGVRVLESGVSGFRLSDDGRFLAVSFSDPPTNAPSELRVTDLVDGTSNELELDAFGVNAGPAAWSPDGRFLIIDEQWEDSTAWVIDPWSGSSDPLPGTDRIGEGACFFSDAIVAHRTWDVGYGQGDAQLGVIRLTALDTGATIADIGTDLFGDGFRCHPDGSISFLRRPVVEVALSPDFSQLEPDRDAMAELIHIAADGTMSTIAVGDLRLV